jgi:hypothetical protein
MLGIDISERMIRVVRLRRSGSGFLLLPPLEVPIEPQQADDPIALGKRLGEALRSRGWYKKKTVMTLPDRLCFIRRLPREETGDAHTKSKGRPHKTTVENLLKTARQTMLVSSDDLVLDLWTKGKPLATKKPTEVEREGVILLGAAQKSVVDFCRELAVASGIKVLSLELRSLASVNGLLFNWHEAPEENIAVVFLSSQQVDIAFMDVEGLFSLQTLKLTSGSEGSVKDSEAAFLKQLPRVFNTLKLSEPNRVPQRVFLGASSRLINSLPPLAEQLRQKIGIEVSICSPEAGLVVAGSRKEKQDHPSEVASHFPPTSQSPSASHTPPTVADTADFQPAIGAALDGLAATPTWFDFRHPQGRFSEKKKPISWKPFVFAAAASILLGCAFWLSLVQQKITERDRLNTSLNQLQPELEKIAKAKNNWHLFRSYLPSSQGGDRLSYLEILYEINQVMPNTREAYLTSLTIIGKKSISPATPSDILITGRVSKGDVITGKVGPGEETTVKVSPQEITPTKDNQSDVSTGFIARLNNSNLFNKAEQAASLTLDVTDSLYPFSFSVTCNLRRAEKNPVKQ